VSEAFGEPVACLELRNLDPEDAPLPVTGTGHRSRFLAAPEVLDCGGPIGFARRWLDEAAPSQSRRGRQEAACQLSFL